MNNIKKIYHPQGPMQQLRLNTLTEFTCFRCRSLKKSKLITIYNNDEQKILCNGCYGLLLSIYEIKSSSSDIIERIEKLSELLFQLAKNFEKINVALPKLASKQNAAEDRNGNRDLFSYLSIQSLKFYATSTSVAIHLNRERTLDWSVAVIGLCKAFEFEVIERIAKRIKANFECGGISSEDFKDKDFGKMAMYCAGRSLHPPELGVIAHLFSTLLNSKERVIKSTFLKTTYNYFFDKQPKTAWLCNKDGFVSAIQNLTRNFRNRAAHIDEMNESDFNQCNDLLFGKSGHIWELITATQDNL